MGAHEFQVSAPQPTTTTTKPTLSATLQAMKAELQEKFNDVIPAMSAVGGNDSLTTLKIKSMAVAECTRLLILFSEAVQAAERLELVTATIGRMAQKQNDALAEVLAPYATMCQQS